jgi:hypothetical protein
MRGSVWTVAVLLAAAACTSTGGPDADTAGVPAPAAAGATGGGSAGPAGSRLPFAVRVEGAQTLVAPLDGAGQQTGAALRLDGRYRLPVVVAGSAPEGLSHDGRTLVLEGSASDRGSRFAVLHSGLTAAPRYIDLPGSFSYDAISPDGSVLYLIEHLPPAGSTHYAVRALDVQAGRLRPDVIVDKRDPDEKMAGRPLSRVASTDGTVVATLYLRETGEPFVHLLYTVDGVAFCADLPRGATTGWTLSYPAGRVLVTDPSGTARHAVDPQGLTVTSLP